MFHILIGRHNRTVGMESRKPFVVDNLSVLMLFASILVFSLVYLNVIRVGETYLVNLSLFMIIFGFVGLVISVFYSRIKYGYWAFESLHRKTLFNAVFYGFIGFVLIMLVSMVSALVGGDVVSVAGDVDKLVVTLTAINEEFIFRGALFTLLYSELKATVYNVSSRVYDERKNFLALLIASVLTSIVFAVFHVGYYSILRNMMFVFLASMVLCFIYYKSKIILAPIIAHILNNLMVVMVG